MCHNSSSLSRRFLGLDGVGVLFLDDPPGFTRTRLLLLAVAVAVARFPFVFLLLIFVRDRLLATARRASRWRRTSPRELGGGDDSEES